MPHRQISTLLLFVTLLGCTEDRGVRELDASVAAPDSLPSDLIENIDQALQTYMEENHLPGAAVVVVHDGQTIFKQGYGFADVEEQRSVDPDQTLFRIGSITKALTLLTITRMVDDGRLSLDDDVADYFGAIPNPNGFEDPVTIANLLTHTAGFDQIGGPGRQMRRYELPLAERKALRPSLSEFLADDNLRRVSPAGEYFRYDTYGTTLAGVVIERVSGLPYAEAMQRELFQPLGMERSFVEAAPSVMDDLALGYGYVNDAYVPQPYEVYVSLPASSIDATVADMGRLLEALTGDGSNATGRFLSAQGAAAVSAPQFKPHPEFHGITHGLMELEARKDELPVPVRTLGHGGDMLGFSADLVLLPEYNLGIFVVANRNGEAGGGGVRVGRPVLSAAIATLYDAPGREPIPLPARVTDQDLSEYTGDYFYGVYCHSCTSEEFARGAWPRSTHRPVTQTEGALSISRTEFLPRGDDVFVQADGARMVYFGRDAKGSVSHFVYSTSLDTFERVPD